LFDHDKKLNLPQLLSWLSSKTPQHLHHPKTPSFMVQHSLEGAMEEMVEVVCGAAFISLWEIWLKVMTQFWEVRVWVVWCWWRQWGAGVSEEPMFNLMVKSTNLFCILRPFDTGQLDVWHCGPWQTWQCLHLANLWLWSWLWRRWRGSLNSCLYLYLGWWWEEAVEYASPSHGDNSDAP